jgi:hypothetical protein
VTWDKRLSLTDQGHDSYDEVRDGFVISLKKVKSPRWRHRFLTFTELGFCRRGGARLARRLLGRFVSGSAILGDDRRRTACARCRWRLPRVMELADEHNERLMLMMPVATFVALRWSSASNGIFAPATCRRYSSSTRPRRSSPSFDRLAVDAKLYGRMQRSGRCAAARKRRAAAETGEVTGSDGSEMNRECGGWREQGVEGRKMIEGEQEPGHLDSLLVLIDESQHQFTWLPSSR